ncbi:MAG: DNA polymerase III subunit gamma/tau [Candidatus Margulisiibacteriota bacterium]
MTYQTLYRKYRSNDLNELVGQSHVIKTLENAIEYGRLSHAYIFSGPRGTGKTSTARILAKMVNLAADSMATCSICKKISLGSCVDVIEIDAASHTGVDYMRQLIEQVQFLPVEAKTKVFIIDEVHMLSTGAFNALLKTLEEPPAQVLFILATTELHKIPATIQSRAQTLHFRLLDPELMKSHLANICQLEGFEINDDALEKVVHFANGGMRDALSLLDQLMSVSENKQIRITDVSMVLGTVDDSRIILFLTKCFQYDLTLTNEFNQMIESGVDVFQFFDDIIHYLHFHFLLNQSHPFKESDKVISAWMMWFFDQIKLLKQSNSPSLEAQISLYSQLASMNSAGAKVSLNVDSSLAKTDTNQVMQNTNPPKQIDAIPMPPNVDQTSSPVTSQVERPSSTTTANTNSDVLKKDPTSLPVSDSIEFPAIKGDIDEKELHILHRVSDEFPVLKPVIKGSKLITYQHVLCLILEETYQFFEKKLSEKKFSDRFLQLYNQANQTQLTDWFVTSDINTVYNQAFSSTPNVRDESSHSVQISDQKTSKTVNQIIEMFEGQIIQ